MEKSNPNQMLTFSDVMDSLHTIQQMEIVPFTKISEFKSEKSRTKTIIEYSMNKMAIIDGILYVTNESIKDHSDLSLKVAFAFLKKSQKIVKKVARLELVDLYSFDKQNVIALVQSRNAFNQR